MQTLTDIDAKILKYIERRGSAETDEIKKKFSNVSAIEYRLKVLSKPEYCYFHNSSAAVPKENSSFLKEHFATTRDEYGCQSAEGLGIFELTEYGKRELQDYIQEYRAARRELWLKSAWIPIIVSLATAVIANYILPKLPQILEWLSSALSKVTS